MAPDGPYKSFNLLLFPTSKNLIVWSEKKEHFEQTFKKMTNFHVTKCFTLQNNYAMLTEKNVPNTI